MQDSVTKTTADAGSAPVSEALYTSVQSFYARHMHLIDQGRVDAWGETFTTDATISNNANPKPAHGRSAIVQVIRRTQGALDERGVGHRHWTGMLTVRRVDDTTVRATSYALLMANTSGAAPVIDRSTRCEDELVLVDGDWQIRDRRVFHDGRH